MVAAVWHDDERGRAKRDVALAEAKDAVACDDIDDLVDAIVNVPRDRVAHLQEAHRLERPARQDRFAQRLPADEILVEEIGDRHGNRRSARTGGLKPRGTRAGWGPAPRGRGRG